jgi:hypothetical protein
MQDIYNYIVQQIMSLGYIVFLQFMVHVILFPIYYYYYYYYYYYSVYSIHPKPAHMSSWDQLLTYYRTVMMHLLNVPQFFLYMSFFSRQFLNFIGFIASDGRKMVNDKRVQGRKCQLRVLMECPGMFIRNCGETQHRSVGVTHLKTNSDDRNPQNGMKTTATLCFPHFDPRPLTSLRSLLILFAHVYQVSSVPSQRC